jgi:hypothetical protein
LDGFHIAKVLNEALDEVRKEQWRNASGDERKTLKGCNGFSLEPLPEA